MLGLCVPVQRGVGSVWWDGSRQGPVVQQRCHRAPGSAPCADLRPGRSPFLVLAGRRKMRVVIQCIALIWGLIFPLFVVLTLPVSVTSSKAPGSRSEAADGECHRQILAQLPFTNNNFILSFLLSVCPCVLCSYKHSSEITCFKSAVAALLFVGVSTCTLSVQTNSLADAVTGSSSLLPFRTALRYLCAQPAALPPPGLFQPAIRWHKNKKSGFGAWTTYSGGVLKRVFAPSVTSPSAAGHCSWSISSQFFSSTRAQPAAREEQRQLVAWEGGSQGQ